ncbi:hypothetical protein HFP51_07950 [Parasphingopyxis sp. CP4]|uniref:hypothetical protein n=1 Tax=Parasphingopyxis sp. CP4 TaxID=2724527 RepID=UPI0015A0A7ED|nr:hypothetical protein [Parasphingopyxis sp. CP4]QLC22118.1 hypothetical protein HFP51_07950 [Parasphingopyxis sp. CP4]
MTIEYTDPAATNANSGEKPGKAAIRVFSDAGTDEEAIIETAVEATDDDALDNSHPANPDAPQPTARLTEIERKLSTTVSKLSARLNKAYGVNERLFGQPSTESEKEQRINGIGQKGVLNAIDRRMYELEKILQSLDEELDKIESIA